MPWEDREIQREEGHVQMKMDWSYDSKSQGTPGATRSRKWQRKDLSLEALEEG